LDLSVAIIDDTDADRERIAADVRSVLAAKGVRCSLSTFPSAEAFLASAPPVDVAFLDIRMGGMDGIELAERLRRLPTRPTVVFVTTSREYALDAYRTHPFDYLLKPYTAEEMRRVLADILDERVASESTIEVGVPYGSMEVALGSIVFAQAQAHHTVLSLANGERLRSTTMFTDAAPLLLGDPRFLEVNRGVVANLDHVVSVEGADVAMDDGARLPLRKRDRSALTLAITRHLVSRVGGRRGGRHRG
jgi:DNA-binding LytR/AlgR family response regulator